jgi:short-chain Z-isoprenyl diphosphate synthase
MSVRSSIKSLLYGLYTRRLSNRLRGTTIPRHVGMIIDGNRRWAQQQYGVTVAEGHRAGAAKMREFLSWCDEAGVEVVTLYLLSTDNLTGRDSEELSNLVHIIADLATDLAAVPNWRVHHLGDASKLPASLRSALERACESTTTHTGLHVNLAVGYGGRHEITVAVHDIIREHEAAGRGIDTLADDITLDNIADHLYTAGQPDLDLVIRTSGEQRISDFMLWQTAHSELYFVEALGPDLREIDFLRALRDFSSRQRRYGK